MMKIMFVVWTDMDARPSMEERAITVLVAGIRLKPIKKGGNVNRFMMNDAEDTLALTGSILRNIAALYKQIFN
jgi:hypothetical protein